MYEDIVEDKYLRAALLILLIISYIFNLMQAYNNYIGAK